MGKYYKGFEILITFLLMLMLFVQIPVFGDDTVKISYNVPSISVPQMNGDVKSFSKEISTIPLNFERKPIQMSIPSRNQIPNIQKGTQNETNAVESADSINVSLIGSYSESPSGWKWRGNLANTGEYDDGGVKPNGKKKWEFKAGTTLSTDPASPSIANGLVYYCTGDLYAVEGSTGKLKWRFDPSPEKIYSTPAIVDGVVYVGGSSPIEKPHFYALNANTGAIIWSIEAGAGGFANPTVSNGVVYVGHSGERKVFAINAKTGNLKWVFPTDDDVVTGPALVNGTLFIADADNLYAINAINGEKRWSYEVISGYFNWAASSPAYANGMIYIGSSKNTKTGNIGILAIDAISGMKKWEYITPAKVQSSPAVSGGKIYFGCDDSKVYALNAATGKKEWEFKTGGKVISSPAISNGIVYVGSWDKVLYALDAKTGKQLWPFLTNGVIISNPVISNGVVFFGSRDGKLYAIGTGKIPAPMNGSLSLSSNPSKAIIIIDGVNTGKMTPISINTLSVGEHVLQLQKSGYFDYNCSFNITKGQTTRIVANLVKPCSIGIQSNPSNAKIWLDNVYSGKNTPATLSYITAGKHLLKLEKDGYQDYLVEIILQNGKTTKVSVNLKK